MALTNDGLDDEREKWGLAIDRLSNVTGALNLPMPAEFHLKQIKSILPEIVQDLRTQFVRITGENPWEGSPE